MAALVGSISIRIFFRIGSLRAGRQEKRGASGEQEEQTEIFHGPKVSTYSKNAKLVRGLLTAVFLLYITYHSQQP